MVGITNDRVLAGVLLPLSDSTAERLMQRNLGRIEEAIRASERETAAGELTSLDAALAEERPSQSGRRMPSRVSIRQLSGARLKQAAEASEVLVVTHANEALALLIPVTLQWTERLVERNLSRIRNSIDRGEQEITRSGLTSLDDFLRELSAEHEGLLTEDQIAEASEVLPPLLFPQDPLKRRIVGVKIITEGDRKRVVGMATDNFARPVTDPVVLPLPSLDEEQVLACVTNVVTQLGSTLAPKGKYVAGVGMQIAGHVHDDDVVATPDADWHHFALADRAQDLLGVPVILENDANALAARAQQRHDIGKDEHAAVILITECGVGAAFVDGGQVRRGSRGVAGEIGHIPVAAAQNAQCRCGRTGCLEAIATPHAIITQLREQGFSGDFGDAVEAARDLDNDLVRHAFTQAGAALGRVLATILIMSNPSTTVLYGPEALVGTERRYRSLTQPQADTDSAALPADEPPLNTAAGLFMHALAVMARARSVSTAFEDCERLFIRHTTDVDGAAAAAECLLQRLPSRLAPERRPRHGVA
ncbi:ROK family protein [Wenjunlia tyrosinilytica]|nr:ROK family protein [Wenjunlia tyrosinilytica]